MSARQITIGFGLAAYGALVLVDRTGGSGRTLALLDRWWPLGLVAVGLIGLLRLLEHPGSPLPPLLLIVAGQLLLLFRSHIDVRPVYSLLWPAALMLLGLVVALTAGRPAVHRDLTNQFRQVVWRRTWHVGGSTDAFRHGEVTVLFSRFELDLREATLAFDGATIEVTAIFGHVRILVPDGWKVLELRPFILGREGLKTEDPPPTRGQPTDKTVLSIRVLGFFGDTTTVSSPS
jgi:hypothetical protein